MEPNYKIEPWNGVPISDETIDRWIRENVNFLQKHPREYHSWTMSGDTMVIVERRSDVSPDEHRFEIYVNKLMKHGWAPKNMDCGYVEEYFDV